MPAKAGIQGERGLLGSGPADFANEVQHLVAEVLRWDASFEARMEQMIAEVKPVPMVARLPRDLPAKSWSDLKEQAERLGVDWPKG